MSPISVLWRRPAREPIALKVPCCEEAQASYVKGPWGAHTHTHTPREAILDIKQASHGAWTSCFHMAFQNSELESKVKKL